ncbi:uncharacterized protein LMH87_007847 [Akanthomyces muscarius]|uniref:Perilipin-like protein MPL1 n=2 Tax=Akanthomyces TaxID=150366 RepID=A0A168JE25_CORDF|nr:uncharacterized protein LMH87_007847 [Akanthomyces muscarius]KAJ4159910.1 hypothetical protein LMH87_007847 [Akanthomyces muscarius]OAA80321.1 perilipin-like protein MPL1 [Akanthomyces lecanii RCEF 1005]
MAVAQVNGNVESSAPQSAFIQHLLNYPVISDSVNTVSSTVHSNPYAQRSLQLGDSAYKTFAAPILPYFAKPYQFVSPYVQRADSLGEQTLTRIDERFPIVKKPTAELYSDAKALVFLPYNKGLEGRDHVFDVYSAEAKKQSEKGYLGQGKAAVATIFQVSNETLALASSYVAVKKAEVTKEVKEKINQ